MSIRLLQRARELRAMIEYARKILIEHLWLPSTKRFRGAVLLCYMLALASCDPGEEARFAAMERVESIAEESPAPVKDDSRIECTGAVGSRNTLKLHLHPGETVLKVFVQADQQVKAGDPLVELENVVLWSSFLSLQSELRQWDEAVERLAVLDLEIEGQEKTIEQIGKKIEKERTIAENIPDYPLEAAIESFLDTMETEKIRLESLLVQKGFIEESLQLRDTMRETIDRQMKILQSRLDRLLVRAPFDGRVSFCCPLPGYLSSGDKILEIIDERSIIVSATILQDHLKYVRENTPVEVYPDYFEDRFVSGKIETIGLPVNESGQDYPKFPLTIMLDETDDVQRLCRLGMTVTVRIPKAEASEKE